jgi:hypothetical protein
MSVTLHEVMLAARARVVPLAAESAGYLLLSLSEKAVQAARRVELSAVELDEGGEVRLLAGEPVDSEVLEQTLRHALDELLKVSSSPGPSLLRAASRPATGNLPLFVAELERALVPVNRTAGRRALVRLCRETERARREGVLEIPKTSEVAAGAAPLPTEDGARRDAPDHPNTAAAAECADAPAVSSIPAVQEQLSVEAGAVFEPVRVPPPVGADSGGQTPTSSEDSEPSTSPETVVALSDSGRPPARERFADRTPYIGSIGLDVIAASAPVVIESPLSPDLPTVAPPPYAGAPPVQRRVGELVESFEVLPGLSDDSLRAELKRVAGIEGTPGPSPVSSSSRRTT